jgi:hypothetical protein
MASRLSYLGLVAAPLVALPAFARAGSSGGHSFSSHSSSSHSYSHGYSSHHYSHGNGHVTMSFEMVFLIMAIVGGLLALSIHNSIKYRRRVAEQAHKADQLQRELAEREAMWRPGVVRQRLESIFPRIQAAWCDEDLSRVRDCLSRNGYEELECKLEDMIHSGHRNIIEDPQLISARALMVVDKPGEADDALWMEVCGRLVDYKVLRSTGAHCEGSCTSAQRFTELWKLVKGPSGQWVLDHIAADGEMERAVWKVESEIDDRPIAAMRRRAG